MEIPRRTENRSVKNAKCFFCFFLNSHTLHPTAGQLTVSPFRIVESIVELVCEPFPECRVVGCDNTYYTVHECRARSCSAHCAALFVTLDTNKNGEQSRFCYQCHKFHNLDEFKAPDGKLTPRHNCYQSQQRRLKRRKARDASRAAILAAGGTTVDARGCSINAVARAVGGVIYPGFSGTGARGERVLAVRTLSFAKIIYINPVAFS